MKYVIDDIHKEFIEGKKLSHFILAGDAKTYAIMVKLKAEYGQFYDWLIPFIGDFHVLMNYHKVIKRLFWDAGLLKLGQLFHKGTTLSSLESSFDFRRNHAFLLEVWEAMFRIQLNSFFEWRITNSKRCQVTQENIESKLVDLFKCLKVKDKYNDMDEFIKQQAFLKKQLFGFEDDFKEFRMKMSESDKTFRFWDDFLHKDCFYYIGLYIGVRSGNWNLRVASLKNMAPLFSVCDFPNYAKLLPEHLADLDLMPDDVLVNLRNGGFVCSLKGNAFESQALDETHESTINKEVKMAISRNNEDLIVAKGLYIPFRAKMLENLMFQINSYSSKVLHKGLLNGEIKARHENVKAYKDCLKKSLLFSAFGVKSALVHIFDKQPAPEKAQHDLLEYHEIGQKRLQDVIDFTFLKNSSRKITFSRQNLSTFTVKKPTKTQTKSKLSENDKSLTYLRKLVAFSSANKQHVNNFGQVLDLPRAIALADGLPYKGSGKSQSTKFFEKLYKEKIPCLFTNKMPAQKECAILEGMFLINTPPLGFMKTFKDYGNFFIQRWVKKYLEEGFVEIHLLFDDPGRHGTSPKDIERMRRDTKAVEGEQIIDLNESSPIPDGKWEFFLKNRANKKLFCNFISKYVIENCHLILNRDQRVIVAGAFDGDMRDCAMIVTNNGYSECERMKSNHEETDSRIWFHVKQSKYHHVLVYSPDTDVYHIGLPFCSEKDVTIELCNHYNKEKYLSMLALESAMNTDFDLRKMDSQQRSIYLRLIFICSGCDFISFFVICSIALACLGLPYKGSGKSQTTFLNIALKFAAFVVNGEYSHERFVAGSS